MTRLFRRAKSDEHEMALCRDAIERINLMIKLGRYDAKVPEGYRYTNADSSVQRAKRLREHYAERLRELRGTE